MKKKVVIALVCVALLLAGFIFFRNRNNTTKNTSVEKGLIREELILSGEISAKNYAKLSFETSGKIVFVGVEEGQKITKGRLISKLDSTVQNSNYQSALSNLRIAEASLNNVYDQLKNKASTENFSEIEKRTTAEANKDKAYEAVISAKRSLDGSSLYAPFNGYVTYLRNPFANVFVTAGTVEAEMIDPQTIFFEVVADQVEALQLKVGQETTIVLDALPDKEFEGKVSSISYTPKLGESALVYSVKVEFKDVLEEKDSLRIAMSGDAKFIINQKEDAYFLPINYVKQDKEGKYIRLDKNGKDKLYIDTGLESTEYLEIVGEGVYEGLTVYD